METPTKPGFRGRDVLKIITTKPERPIAASKTPHQPTSVSCNASRYNPLTNVKSITRSKSSDCKTPATSLVNRLGNTLAPKTNHKINYQATATPAAVVATTATATTHYQKYVPSTTPHHSYMPTTTATTHYHKYNPTTTTPHNNYNNHNKIPAVTPHNNNFNNNLIPTVTPHNNNLNNNNNNLIPAVTPHYHQHQQNHNIIPPTTPASSKLKTTVNGKTYIILRKIGVGGSAIVYEGYESNSSRYAGSTVAIKIINIAKADQRTKESYFNEKFLLTQLRNSKHVVRLYDSEYKTDLKELILVMEKGDVDLSKVIESHFKTRDENMIEGEFIRYYWRRMVRAVDDIHQHGIVHADLKPVNFILVENEIKLIDFGIANTIDPDATSIIKDYQIGTINFMAPEALRNRAGDLSFQNLMNTDENNHHHDKRTIIKYNSKADIWSLGCILYYLVYGKPPFDRIKDLGTKVHAITNPCHEIEFPELNNRNLLNCMKSCLRYNPLDRPTARELLCNPYLEEDILRIHRKS